MFLIVAGGLIGGGSWYASRGHSPAGANQASTSARSTLSASKTAAAPKALTRDQAWAALEKLVVQDRAKKPVRGQWVAMIDSKFEGLSDPMFKAAAFTVPEILTLHQQLRGNKQWGSRVRLLHNGDWGRSSNGRFMWVTIVDLNARARSTVERWCVNNRPRPASDPTHFCLPKQMTLP